MIQRGWNSANLVLLAVGLFSITTIFAAPILTQDKIPVNERIEMSNAWVEIDATTFAKNINHLKEKVTDAALCPVVKADAYGHGLALLLPKFIEAEIGCLGIGSNEEARISRENGFTGTLMRIRTATPNEVKHALQYNVEELVGSLELAEKLDEIAKENDKIIPIHFAINAGGLARNGIDLTTENGKEKALQIAKLDGIKIVALMTHFPVEEIEDVKQDLALFNEQSAWFIKAAGLSRESLTLHSANTFATLNVPESHLDMVRVASALFGYDAEGFEEIYTFKTSVAGINQYPEGTTVGYDRTYVLTRDSRLANLPIGYSDGYHRVLGNQVDVLIKGHRVPVIGKISMNTSVVDVTDFPDINVGDEVVLYGKQGEERITADDIEAIIGTLLVDAYTIWGNSNPRVLKQDK